MENGEIEARTAGQVLGNAQKKLDILGNALIPITTKMAEGKNATNADLMGLAGAMQAAGAFKSREEALELVTQLAGSSLGTPDNRNELVRRIVSQTQNGREALDKNMQSIEKQYAPVEGIDPNTGRKIMQPRKNYPGLLPPNGSEIAPAASQAPSGGAGARQETSPSGSPATQQYPMVEEAAATTKAREEEVQRFNEAKKQILGNLQGVNMIEQRLGEAETVLKEFKTGPGRETYMKMATLAGALGLDEMKDALAGGDYAAAQEFVKLMVPQSLELLRNTLGGQGRITNLEVEQFFKANPNPETDEKAIANIFKFMRRINMLAREEAHAFERYEDRARREGKYNITTFDNDWADRMARDPVLKKRAQ